MPFKIVSDFKPTGDQPEAIRQLTEGVNSGAKAQTLLGVTGSGKTFTMANIINSLNRPSLIMAPNKTLAAQLYAEMKDFFPNNRQVIKGSACAIVNETARAYTLRCAG